MSELDKEIFLAEKHPAYYAAGIDAARVLAKFFLPQPSTTISPADAESVVDIVRERLIAGSGEERFFSNARLIVQPGSEEQREALLAGTLTGHIEVAREYEEGRLPV